ncbi:MAG TPA: hypothetical protein VK485_02260 [Sphingomicrobium sp.]|nr:hypothetical protein [Sphingomicrobium sp.]
MMQPRTSLAVTAALLLVAGCNKQASQQPGNEVAAPAASTPSAMLRAAAEPFEVLTEESFAAAWDRVDKLIGDARGASAKARGVMSPAQAVALDQSLAMIADARRARDRPALALASVETYRQLVEAQDPAAAEPPIAVSLLDYAGFRYDALVQAPRVDWAAVHDASSFAQQQWKAIEPAIKSDSLKGAAANSVNALDTAAAAQNVAVARSAAATELAMVDLLEEHLALQGKKTP